MWLINCSTYRLEPSDVGGPDETKYWILSHTWGADEVTFQDMQNPQLAASKRGFNKIKGICDLALKNGCGHVWVDTCCIDKSSSAELTESINSMFYWYEKAVVCIAYLEDLEPGTAEATEEDLRNCRWFTRGWTLQELISPDRVEFYDRQWNPRGTKRGLFATLHVITSIDKDILKGIVSLSGIAVARKMSWAARRQTTRIEDRAYSLLGIFNVHMPLLYGERDQAFIRLQQAIAQKSNDMSLFAWVTNEESSDRPNSAFAGLFAHCPSQFSICTGIVQFRNHILPTPSWSITNAGIELSTALDWSVDSEYHVISSDWNKKRCSQPLGIFNPWDLGPQPGSLRARDRSRYRLLLHCTDESLLAGEGGDPPVICVWLCKTRHGFVRFRRTDLCVVRQSAMVFSDLTPIRIATAFTREHQTDLASVLHPHLLFCRSNSIHIRWDITAPDVDLQFRYHPEHLWDRQELRVPISGVSSSDFTIGLVEMSLTSMVNGQPATQTCWVFCRLTNPRASPWIELVRPEPDGSVSLLGKFNCKRGDLVNPYALSSIASSMLRSMSAPDRVSLSPEGCIVQCAPAVAIKISATLCSELNFHGSITVTQFDPTLETRDA